MTDAGTNANPGESFEDLLKELESIVKDLEAGRLTLEESLDRYQRGVARLKRCYELLDQAEKKIEILTRDEEGNITFTPLEASTLEGTRGSGVPEKPPRSGKGDRA